MRLSREERRARRKERRAKKNVLRAARQILRNQYGVDPGYLNGIGSVLKYISFYRPDLANLQGESRIAVFAGIGMVAAGERAPRQAKVQKPKIDPNGDAFLESYEWRRVRMVVLKRDGARCGCCGATPADGVKMHVDHIKPRKKFPELALDPNNLQVLCEVCNHGKGNWDQTDWRPSQEAANDEQQQHIRSIVEGQ